MGTLEDLKRDLKEIVGSGINHTATVMELLRKRGWPDGVIVPAVYQLLLTGVLDPKGQKVSYRQN